MNRVTLNLATRPFRNNMVVGSVLLGVAAAAIAATVYNGYAYTNYGGRYQELRQEEKHHRERTQALESDERTLSREIASRDFRRLKGRGQFAADLILKRTFSWTLLFNKLENVVPPEVMMTAIRPHISGEGIFIRVEGIAKNHGALIALEDSLLKNPAFASVYPASERRLNPSRPEISFVLQFDYLSSKAIPGPDAVASGAVPGSPATPGEATVSAAAPAPGGTATAAVPDAPQAGAQRTATEAESHPVMGTVGRDGRPRTPEVLAHMLAAPGGFYPSTPPPAPLEAPSPAKGSKGRQHDAKPGPAPGGAVAAPARGGAPVTSGPQGSPATPAKIGAPGAPPPSGGEPLVSGAGVSPAAWQDGALASQVRPPLVAGLPLRRDPNLGPPPVPKKPKASPARPVEPIPATRLDVPLKFSARAVGDVYVALSRAHGVRFDLDPTVDRRAPVSADLAGKNLKDAIAVLSKLAGHKVLRVEDGVYRVVPLAGGEPLADRPVQEEPLPATEGKP